MALHIVHCKFSTQNNSIIDDNNSSILAYCYAKAQYFERAYLDKLYMGADK